jgi:hypothetical protein
MLRPHQAGMRSGKGRYSYRSCGKRRRSIRGSARHSVPISQLAAPLVVTSALDPRGQKLASCAMTSGSEHGLTSSLQATPRSGTVRRTKVLRASPFIVKNFTIPKSRIPNKVSLTRCACLTQRCGRESYVTDRFWTVSSAPRRAFLSTPPHVWRSGWTTSVGFTRPRER